ncbi:ubiquitin carboxyl-terminal hydrolase [Cercophora newfieldiana]|uniref:Ubiquitin carboxyl-terminal hydrolase n=1 Tax=Cercophora newfieldiana TaxID=92897 RepID=A0AA40CRM8_9PEZI|nr:ubiquitin carboxyl-terminal hydrolase [Cercophora newfieldiana]
MGRGRPKKKSDASSAASTPQAVTPASSDAGTDSSLRRGTRLRKKPNFLGNEESSPPRQPAEKRPSIADSAVGVSPEDNADDKDVENAPTKQTPSASPIKETPTKTVPAKKTPLNKTPLAKTPKEKPSTAKKSAKRSKQAVVKEPASEAPLEDLAGEQPVGNQQAGEQVEEQAEEEAEDQASLDTDGELEQQLANKIKLSVERALSGVLENGRAGGEGQAHSGTERNGEDQAEANVENPEGNANEQAEENADKQNEVRVKEEAQKATDGDEDVSPTVRRSLRKRKAASESLEGPAEPPMPNNLLDAALAPWAENEAEDWPHWMDLESDPAFFTHILRKIGVSGVKLADTFADMETLKLIPNLYGLILLMPASSYVEQEEVEVVEDGKSIWFANQTTNNACGTIAMLNLIMNVEGLDLDDRLEDFRERSKDLSPPQRGALITRSTWIRAAHNAFSRRINHLGAALSLAGEARHAKMKKKSPAKSKPKAKPKAKSKAKSKPMARETAKSKNRPMTRGRTGAAAQKAAAEEGEEVVMDAVQVGGAVEDVAEEAVEEGAEEDEEKDEEEDAEKEDSDGDDVPAKKAPSSVGSQERTHHFIAFVPIENRVWRLDGLQCEPSVISVFDENTDWFTVPIDEIQLRMEADGSQNWGLLAMCADPDSFSLERLRKEIAINVACIEALDNRWNTSPFWTDMDEDFDSNTILCATNIDLAQFGLDDNGIEAILEKDSRQVDSLQIKYCGKDADISEAIDCRERLVRRQKVLRTSYLTRSTGEKEEELVPELAALQDFTPAIHEWLKKLAEHGALQGLHDEVVAERMAQQHEEQPKEDDADAEYEEDAEEEANKKKRKGKAKAKSKPAKKRKGRGRA